MSLTKTCFYSRLYGNWMRSQKEFLLVWSLPLALPFIPNWNFVGKPSLCIFYPFVTQAYTSIFIYVLQDVKVLQIANFCCKFVFCSTFWHQLPSVYTTRYPFKQVHAPNITNFSRLGVSYQYAFQKCFIKGWPHTELLCQPQRIGSWTS